MKPGCETVLVVDDDSAIADALKDALEDEGYRVDVCDNGNSALAYLRSQPAPCIILLDWMMPGCDGATFRARQIADPTIADVPVVLLTADIHLEKKKDALKAMAYLPKPVNLGLLLAIVEKHCQKRSA